MTHILLHRLYLSAQNWRAAVGQSRKICTSRLLCELQKQSSVVVVDNSMIGHRSVVSNKKPKIIQVYNKPGVARLGDKVLVAIMGEKKKGYVVGCRQKQQANIPRFDTNNVVLVEDNGVPTGTRIRVPISSSLRGKEGDFTKILSMATKFI